MQHQLRVNHRAAAPSTLPITREHRAFREEHAAHLFRPQPQREEQAGFGVALLQREDKKHPRKHRRGNDQEKGEADEKLAEIDRRIRRGERLFAQRERI